MHDVEPASYITSILKSRLNMCGALKTSGRLIVQTSIHLYSFDLCNKDQIFYKSFTRKYITRPIQTNLILIKRKQLTPSTQTLHPVLHHEYLLVYQERTNGFGKAEFPQERR